MIDYNNIDNYDNIFVAINSLNNKINIYQLNIVNQMFENHLDFSK